MTYSLPPTRQGGNQQWGRLEEKKSDCFSKGEDLLDGWEKRTNYLLGMATTDPHHHLKGALHERIV
jgi:hypothetical protein